MLRYTPKAEQLGYLVEMCTSHAGLCDYCAELCLVMELIWVKLIGLDPVKFSRNTNNQTVYIPMLECIQSTDKLAHEY